jgi:hypothetical protein
MLREKTSFFDDNLSTWRIFITTGGLFMRDVRHWVDGDKKVERSPISPGYENSDSDNRKLKPFTSCPKIFTALITNDEDAGYAGEVVIYHEVSIFCQTYKPVWIGAITRSSSSYRDDCERNHITSHVNTTRGWVHCDDSKVRKTEPPKRGRNFFLRWSTSRSRRC